MGCCAFSEILFLKLNEFNKVFFFVAVFFQYNEVYDVSISCDTAGMIEYWAGQKRDFGFPKNLKFEYKTDTDLFEFVAVSIFFL